MLNKLKIGIASVAIIVIAGCGGGDKHGFTDYQGVTGDNGIDFYASETLDSAAANCFYRGRGTIPNRSTTQGDLLDAQLIFIGHDNRTGSFARFELDDPTTTNLETLIKAGDYAGFEAQLPATGYSAYDYSDFGRDVKNPFDLNINWYSKLAFVLIEPSETFRSTAPFRVAISVPGAKSPFRSITEQGDQIIVVDYTSLPPRSYINGYDTISKRDCNYYYDLNIIQSFDTGSGGTVQVPVTIDPGGTNDNGPGGDVPPGWP